MGPEDDGGDGVSKVRQASSRPARDIDTAAYMQDGGKVLPDATEVADNA